MLLAQWSCEVPMKNKERFLEYERKVLRPFYLSHGARRHEVFFPADTERTYFSYQVKEEKGRCTEQLLFDDLKAWERFHEETGKDPRGPEILGSYERDFGVTGCRFIVVQQAV